MLPPVTDPSDLRPGLLRRTAPHPDGEADAEPGSPAREALEERCGACS
jgi:hypothetical protein